VFGIKRAADSTLQIEKVTPALASPHSALHQGPINVALESAAIDELQRAFGSVDFQVEGYTVMMVKPGYVGPFVATAKVVNPKRAPAPGTRVAVESTLIDAGAKNRTIATASAAFRRVR
jgi:acyl-coenzyme A thioesterase PaaI-like protein